MLLVIAGGSVIASSVLTGGVPPIWFGVALVLGAPLLAVISWVMPAKVAHEVAEDPDRYGRVRRGQLIGAWISTTIAALIVVTGLVLLFVRTEVGAIFTGIGALYFSYRLFHLRNLYMR